MSILGFAWKTPALRFAAPVAAALLATTCAASAGTLTYTGATITGLPITFSPTDSGYAGQIHLTTADGSVNVWSVDLFDNLSLTGGTFTILPSSALSGAPGVPTLTSQQAGEIGGLKFWGDGARPFSPNVAAAVQLAIWTIEYGSVTYDPLGPPVDSPSGGYVADLLAWVGDGIIPLAYNFQVLIEAGNQTLIMDIPEPSTWAMMLLGFAGLGFAGYRRAGRTTA
jgi:PEP-CTERM motif